MEGGKLHHLAFSGSPKHFQTSPTSWHKRLKSSYILAQTAQSLLYTQGPIGQATQDTYVNIHFVDRDWTRCRTSKRNTSVENPSAHVCLGASVIKVMPGDYEGTAPHPPHTHTLFFLNMRSIIPQPKYCWKETGKTDAG